MGVNTRKYIPHFNPEVKFLHFFFYLEHEAVDFDVNMLVWFLRVVELVDLHELLQTLPEVEGEKIEPHQTARIQNQLQGVQLGVQVGTRDWRNKRKGGRWKRYGVKHL